MADIAGSHHIKNGSCSGYNYLAPSCLLAEWDWNLYPSEDWDSSYSQDLLKANENIINIHDFLCQCKHKRLTLSPNEHIGAFSLEQMEEFNNATN